GNEIDCIVAVALQIAQSDEVATGCFSRLAAQRTEKHTLNVIAFRHSAGIVTPGEYRIGLTLKLVLIVRHDLNYSRSNAGISNKVTIHQHIISSIGAADGVRAAHPLAGANMLVVVACVNEQ